MVLEMEKRASLRCYNKGCGKEFLLSDNGPDACVYHCGEPYFHDAYKGWSCCKKKTTDFTEFLNTKGCSQGPHNPTKPVEVEKPKVDTVTEEPAPVAPPPKPKPRPSEHLPLEDLQVSVAASLQQIIEERKTEQKAKVQENSSKMPSIGEACKNKGCQKNYLGPDAKYDLCNYHPGTAVFHEGLKFWTCCLKKTTDFSAFLAQEGCEAGQHKWIETEEEKRARTACRHDWFQTASHVNVSVYAKNTVPEQTTVKVNPVKLVADIGLPDNQQFSLHVILAGVIDVQKSSVNMMATKVEIKLKKAEPGSWPGLFTTNLTPAPVIEPPKTEEETLTEKIDYVDLSDL